MEASNHWFSLFFVILAIIFCIERPVHSFTIDLIHRDFPQSPFYNHLATKWDRLDDAFRRSVRPTDVLTRLSLKSPKDIQSQLDPSVGEFLMKLSIGNPPVQQWVIFDSGSDLTWLQIKHCDICFNQTGLRNDPEYSTTFRNISCNAPSCKELKYSRCSGNGTDTCNYLFSYMDNSLTIGYLGTETFMFESASKHPVSIPNLMFGCGTFNTKFDGYGTDGLLGMGRGKGSFINQLGKHMDRKFSYCLPMPPPYSRLNVTGKISFGNSVRVRRPGAVIVPLKKYTDSHIITLESISFNDNRLAFSEEIKAVKMNVDVLLDSGTYYTYLPAKLFSKFYAELQKFIPAKLTLDEESGLLCYNSAEKIIVPKIKLKFKGAGVEVVITEKNTFLLVNQTSKCLAIAGRNTSHGVIGSVMQSNFLIGFDLGKNLVSFAPSDCTK